MFRSILTVLLLVIFSNLLYPQSTNSEKISQQSFLSPSDSLNVNRRTSVLVTESVAVAGSLFFINKQWYPSSNKANFHFNEDANGWGMMDKAGHGFATYQLTRFTAEAFNWSGESKTNQLIYATAFGLGTATIKEAFDGFSKDWGWSWYDFGSNVVGSALYVGQELLWNEQRIQSKFSYNNSKSRGIVTTNVGEGFLDRAFKNYDGQTYWLSFNINSFAKTDYIPNWLNLSVGYTVDGYLYDAQATIIPQKSKSLLLSLDVDLTKIKTKSNFMNTLFNICNTIKIPAPTIEFNSKESTKGYFFYF